MNLQPFRVQTEADNLLFCLRVVPSLPEAPWSFFFRTNDGPGFPQIVAGPAGDHVLPRIDGVDEVQRYGGHLLLQVKDQGLRPVPVGRGQALHGQGAGEDLIGIIDEIIGEGAVGQGQLRGRVPKIPLAHAAPLEGHVLQAVGVAAVVVEDGGSPDDGGLDPQGRPVGKGHGAAVMEVLQVAEGGHPKEVGRVVRQEAECFVAALDHGTLLLSVNSIFLPG